MNLEAYYCLAHVRPHENKPNILNGSVGAYVNTLALAEDAKDCKQYVEKILARLGFTIIGLENIEKLANIEIVDKGLSQTLLNMDKELSEENPIIFDEFQAYDKN